MNTAKTRAADAFEPIHLATIDWQRGKWSAARGKYSREHLWHFAEGLSLKVSDAIAPAAYRNGARLDPLKAFVAMISSAHMLAFLHAAFSHEAEVERYLDAAEGVLAEDSEGVYWVSDVILKPRVTFHSQHMVTAVAVTHFHELAQEHCFIARSLKTKVTIRSV
jgi:organic hydroperoxide reductase OsmC/OhrA